MNSPAAPDQTQKASQASAHPTFNWIEYIIIPIASSIMEAQPIALILLFLPIFFLGTFPSGPILDQGAIVLILLGLHWWAMFTRVLIRRSGDEHLTRPLQLQGLVLACIFVCGLQLLAGNTIPGLIIPGALVIWAWRRGILWTEKDTHDEQLVTVFKIGFIIIIVILLLSILRYLQVSSDIGLVAPQGYILTALAPALPLFFLSGWITLSFTRLEIIRKDSIRNTLGSSRLDPTRIWRLILALTWIALVALCFILETFSLAPLRALLTPIWNLVLGILAAVLYVIFAILSLFIKPLAGVIPTPPLFHRPPVTSQGKGSINYGPGIPPTVEIIILTLITIAMLLLVFFIIRAVLQHRKYTQDEESMNEEEERESLSMSAILKARREERQQRKQDLPAFELGPLDPASARAHYRELLLTTAQNQSGLAWRTAETPYEYQKRLKPTLEHTTIQGGEETRRGLAVLADLTDAYTRERYGNKQLDQSQKSYLDKWVPNLLRRLTGAGSSPQSSTPHDRLPNKWGD